MVSQREPSAARYLVKDLQTGNALYLDACFHRVSEDGTRPKDNQINIPQKKSTSVRNQIASDRKGSCSKSSAASTYDSLGAFAQVASKSGSVMESNTGQGVGASSKKERTDHSNDKAKEPVYGIMQTSLNGEEKHP